MIWKIPFLACFLICIALLVKLFKMRISLGEITDSLHEKLQEETNTPITVTSSDSAVCALASALNSQLRILRKEQLHLQSGNHELQNAITNIAHDLRTPLTAISGYMELLGGTDLPPKAREYCSVIEERTAALFNLTEELFKYTLVCASSDELRLEPVNIKAVLEESIAGFYQQLLSANITPELQLPDDAVIRQLDRNALRRVFDNLISNGVKYSEGDLSISLTEDGVVSFANTSHNLDRLSVGRLFDRFYTVESAGSSSGIGLSVAKLLTEKMGGSIRAELINCKLIITVHLYAPCNNLRH